MTKPETVFQDKLRNVALVQRGTSISVLSLCHLSSFYETVNDHPAGTKTARCGSCGSPAGRVFPQETNSISYFEMGSLDLRYCEAAIKHLILLWTDLDSDDFNVELS